MNPPKVTDEDYVNFIIAPSLDVTATEAERVQPVSKDAPRTTLLPGFCSALNRMPKHFGRNPRRK